MQSFCGKLRTRRPSFAARLFFPVRHSPLTLVSRRVRCCVPRDPANGWGAWGVLLGGVVSAHCAYLPPDSCALGCMPETHQCPEAFECQLSTDRCVRKGVSESCTSLGSEPDDGVADHPLLPTPPAPVDVTPEASGGAGLGPPAPGGATPEDTAPLVVVSVAGTDLSGTVLCTDAPLALRWQASGGVSPYTWQVTAAPAGLSLQHVEGSEFTLSGTPVEAGSVEVNVSDAIGQLASYRATVHEHPRILTSKLQGVCPEEIYSVPLAASGGDPASYHWFAEVGSAFASTGSLTDLGLAVDAAGLHGIFSAPGGAAPITIDVQLADAYCSAKATLALEVLPTRTATCPLLRVSDSELEDVQELPAPCIGSSYRERLWLEGGAPEARLERVSGPTWLALDAAQQLLSGTAGEAGQLIVRVATPDRTLQHQFNVVPREKCWFAWVDAAATPARLELVDARRLTHRSVGSEASDARRSFPSESTASPVTDFQFSPDGRFIAYRVAEDEKSRRLVFLDLLTQQEQPLFSQVSGYSWSRTGTALAALTGPEDAPRLELAQRVGAEGEVPQFQRSAADLGGSASSRPVWFGTSGVALLEADPQLPIVRPARLQLDLGASSLVLLDEAYQPTTQLRGGPDGFFVLAPYNVRFYAPGRERVPHDDVVVSPSGRFVGRAREGYLRVFHDYESASDNDPATGATAGGCSALLAWAAERERIACYSEEAQQLAIYDLLESETGSLQLAHAGNIEGPYLYSTSVADGRRRLFSRTGRSLAFSTLQGVYVANLDPTATEPFTPPFSAVPLASTVPVPDSPPPELLFSPDERSLLVQMGGTVRVLDLEPARDLLLAADLATAAACTEDVSDAIGGWCGTPTISPRLVWSASSEFVLTQTEAGLLRLHDMTQGGDPLGLDPGCGAACSADSYGFQP
jgi:hypothetical protein